MAADGFAKIGLELLSSRFSTLPENFASVILSASYCSRKSKRIFIEEKPGDGQVHKYTASQMSNPHRKFSFEALQTDFVSSDKFRDEAKYKHGHLIRAQLHMLFLAPFGYAKSSTFRNFKECEIITRMTEAALTGSITKDGNYSPGVSQRAAGKYIVFDEIQNAPVEVRNAMLALLEEQKHSRSLGFITPKQIRENVDRKEFEKKLWSVECTRGDLTVKSIFSSCCTGLETMSQMLRKSANMNNMAWLSRLVPIIVTGNLDDAYAIHRGELKLQPFKNIKPYTHQLYFKDYLEAVKRHKELMMSMPFITQFQTDKAGLITRNIDDTVRLAGYFCACENRSEITLEDFEMALVYQPLVLYNVLSSYLTRLEIDILTQILNGRENDRIAHELECHINTVLQTREKAAALNLIKIN